MRSLTLLLLCLGFYFVSSQPINRTFVGSNEQANILGLATIDRLMSEPFREWYVESYENYEVNEPIVKSINQPDSITIFMGTWCGDSKREVPRFLKMLEVMNFDMEKLKVVCLNTGFQNYKQAPDREERGQYIHRVPTFIMTNDQGEELGRIVEEPVTSLEQDMKDIMDGKSYETYYPVANDLTTKFNTYTLKELKKMRSELVKLYKGKAVNPYELNTYGYVLWSSFDLLKAEFVLELNTKLFPESAIPFGTLARFKNSLGKQKEAQVAIRKGLVIDPEDKRLLNLQAISKNQ